MRHLSRLALALSLCVGTLSVYGCNSNGQQPSSDSQAGTSGGNGTMGENPAHPGSYSGDKYNTPPTTQPANP